MVKQIYNQKKLNNYTKRFKKILLSLITYSAIIISFIVLFAFLMDYNSFLLYQILNTILSIVLVFTIIFVIDFYLVPYRVKIKQINFLKNLKPINIKGLIIKCDEVFTKNKLTYRTVELKVEDETIKTVNFEKEYFDLKINDKVLFEVANDIVVKYKVLYE